MTPVSDGETRHPELRSSLARQVLCPDVDEAAFENDLRLGEIISRVIAAGNKARKVIAYGENARRGAELSVQIKRLESIL